jgi:hypothetical protein
MIFIHVVVLYGAILIAIAATALTWRRRESPPLPPWEVTKTILPFLLIALTESLVMTMRGHLVAEWLLPMLAGLFATWCSRSPLVIRACRVGLFLVALVTWVHGHVLTESDYVTWPRAVAPGRHAEADWYTPLTGMRHLQEGQ